MPASPLGLSTPPKVDMACSIPPCTPTPNEFPILVASGAIRSSSSSMFSCSSFIAFSFRKFMGGSTPFLVSVMLTRSRLPKNGTLVSISDQITRIQREIYVANFSRLRVAHVGYRIGYLQEG